jgi:hypothetical protein
LLPAFKSTIQPAPVDDLFAPNIYNLSQSIVPLESIKLEEESHGLIITSLHLNVPPLLITILEPLMPLNPNKQSKISRILILLTLNLMSSGNEN